MNTRLLLSITSVGAVAAAIVACSSPAEQNETLGEQQQGICVNYPCTRLGGGTSGRLGTSSGLVMDPDPGITFNCSGPVPGAPEGYKYMIDQETGKCAIFKPDPTACYDVGAPDPDAGRICFGYSVVSYYICPVNHPNMTCSSYYGTCSCY